MAGRVATVTVTGFLGPGRQVTTLVFQKISNVNLNFAKDTIELTEPGDVKQQIDMDDITVVSVANVDTEKPLVDIAQS